MADKVVDYNGKEIKVGDTVRRVRGNNHGMQPGDTDTVTVVSPDSYFGGIVTTKEYRDGHIPGNLEVINANPLITKAKIVTTIREGEIEVGQGDSPYVGRSLRVIAGPHKSISRTSGGTVISLKFGGEEFNASQLRGAAKVFNEFAEALDQIDKENS